MQVFEDPKLQVVEENYQFICKMLKRGDVTSKKKVVQEVVQQQQQKATTETKSIDDKEIDISEDGFEIVEASTAMKEVDVVIGEKRIA